MNNRLYQGHIARKRFGQNFLTDQCVIDSIIAAIHPQRGQIMIEIGPGLGALTKLISKFIDRIIVIELDLNLATRLANNSLLNKKLTIYKQDVMTVNFADIARKEGKLLRIFGNLPYNISTPLIFHLLIYTQVVCDMHFMLQKEVANRLVAQPDSKSYGRLSVMTQYYCNVLLIFDVPPTAFHPTPKVDSTLVRLVPHKVIPHPVYDIRLLQLITMKAFNQRRKTIRNSLDNLFTPVQLIKLGIDDSLRAENLSIIQYCKLANWLSHHLEK